MSDTPETDANVIGYVNHVVPSHFARRLERERDAANKRIMELAGENTRLRTWIEKTGLYNDICTYEVLGEICQDCNCERGKE